MDPFEALEDHYPEIIARMGRRFNAHRFILMLAQMYQGLYIQALAQYADHPHPFMVVHSRIVWGLARCIDLVQQDGIENSTDIFGNSNTASVWVKRPGM